MSDFDRQLRLRDTLIRKHISGRFLDVHDLMQLCDATSHSFSSILLIPRHQGRNIVTLCCARIDRATSLLPDQAALDAALGTFTTLPHHTLLHDTCNIFYVKRPSTRLLKMHTTLLLEIVQFIIVNTLHYFNVTGDYLARAGDKATTLAGRHASDSSLTADERVLGIIKDLRTLHVGFATGDIITANPTRKRLVSRSAYFNNSFLTEYRFRSILVAVLKRQTLSVVHHNDKEYIAIPLSTRGHTSLFPHSLFLAEHTTPLSAKDIQSLSTILTSYQSGYIDAAKASLLGLLEQTLRAGIPDDPQLITWSYIRKYMKTAISAIGQILLFSTNSHSVVFRRFVASKCSLEPEYEAEQAFGVLHTNRPRSISITKLATSCNAFSFKRCSYREGYIIIGNVKDIPRAYKERGLLSVYTARPNTRSEITAPVFFKETPLGTLNLESSEYNNYDRSKDFLLLIARMIGRYVEALVERFDSRWIGRVAQSRAAIHEARQVTFAELSSAQDGPLRAANRDAVKGLHEWIEAALEKTQPGDAATLGALIDLEILQRPAHQARARERLKLSVDVIRRLPVRGNEHIAYIIRELLSNHFQSRRADNRLRMSFAQMSGGLPLTGCITRGYIIFELNLGAHLSEEQTALLALSPITLSERSSYGMYLCGILIRAAGGWIDVESVARDNNHYTHVSIRLPVTVPA